jgi:hypothetical protein
LAGDRLQQHIQAVRRSNNPSEERLATAFRDVAKQVGVTVSLRIMVPDKFFAEMVAKEPFNADGFYDRSTPDLMTYASYHSGSWNATLHRRQGRAGEVVRADALV